MIAFESCLLLLFFYSVLEKLQFADIPVEVFEFKRNNQRRSVISLAMETLKEIFFD